MRYDQTMTGTVRFRGVTGAFLPFPSGAVYSATDNSITVADNGNGKFTVTPQSDSTGVAVRCTAPNGVTAQSAIFTVTGATITSGDIVLDPPTPA